MQRKTEPTKRPAEKAVQAILDGVPAATVKDRMAAREARKTELETAIAERQAPPPALHPEMPGI